MLYEVITVNGVQFIAISLSVCNNFSIFKINIRATPVHTPFFYFCFHAFCFKKYDLLLALWDRDGAVATRHEPMKSVWSYQADVPRRTVGTHIGELRRNVITSYSIHYTKLYEPMKLHGRSGASAIEVSPIIALFSFHWPHWPSLRMIVGRCTWSAL